MAGQVIKRIWTQLEACFQANPGPMTRSQIVAWISSNAAEQFKPSTLYQQIRRSCSNLESAKAYPAPKILHFDQSSKCYSLLAASASSSDSEPYEYDGSSDSGREELGTEDQSDLLVGVEAQLRDYLAKNLKKLESGLEFWIATPPSVEFNVSGKRIDILAKDSTGLPVVVELKRGRGYDRVIGQALLYQALIANELKHERVRVIIVANSISDELRLASSRQRDIKLFEYELSMQLTEVGPEDQGEEEWQYS